MSTRADDIIDRRRLRRKLTFWRVLTILVAAVAIGSAYWWGYGGQAGGVGADHIARIKIEGTITENEELIERIDRIRQSARVKGVILSIDSPGGTTAGGEAIYEEIRRLAGEKPVVAQVGTLAASAGYMIATAADHIVARQSSIVGSIGVLVQYPDLTGLLDKVGVRMETIKSSPLKAEPSPLNPTTEEERQMIRAMILDSYEWFKDLVEERRPLDAAEVATLADGSVFTGRQALGRKLVDTLGGEREAVAWLATKGVDAELKVIEWKPQDTRPGYFPLLGLAWIASQLTGAAGYSADMIREFGADRMFLDGLLSVWQPEKTH